MSTAPHSLASPPAADAPAVTKGQPGPKRKPGPKPKFPPPIVDYLETRTDDFMRQPQSRRHSMKKAWYKAEWELFKEVNAELMKQYPERFTNLQVAFQDFCRYFWNRKRYLVAGNSLPADGVDSESQTLVNILAGLFDLELDAPNHTAFKLYVEEPENCVRHLELANAELMRLDLDKNHMFYILRSIRSKEFKALPVDVLNVYHSRAAELNKHQNNASKRPVDAEHILKNQLKIVSVIQKLFGAFIGHGYAQLGHSAFHIQYALWSEERGVNIGSIGIGSTPNDFVGTRQYQSSGVANYWAKWATENLTDGTAVPVRVAADSNIDQDSACVREQDDLKSLLTTLDSPSLFATLDMPIDLLPNHLPGDIDEIRLTPPLLDSHGAELVPAITGKVIKDVVLGTLSSHPSPALTSASAPSSQALEIFTGSPTKDSTKSALIVERRQERLPRKPAKNQAIVSGQKRNCSLDADLSKTASANGKVKRARPNAPMQANASSSRPTHDRRPPRRYE